MKKGDIRIKRKKRSKDYVTFDPRISNDRKTFVLRVESGTSENWYTYLAAIYSYVTEEMERIGLVDNLNGH